MTILKLKESTSLFRILKILLRKKSPLKNKIQKRFLNHYSPGTSWMKRNHHPRLK